MNKVCKITGCGRIKWAKDMCIMHYKIQWRHPLYVTWDAMKQRCSNPNTRKYHLYGGREVKVCKRWLVFDNFLKDMGDKPSPKHTLERIDNNGDYEPSNVKWATYREQNFNQRIRSDNTSGVTGVFLDKRRNKWYVRFHTNGKYQHFGYYDDLKDAVKRRKEVFEEHHGV